MKSVQPYICKIVQLSSFYEVCAPYVGKRVELSSFCKVCAPYICKIVELSSFYEVCAPYIGKIVELSSLCEVCAPYIGKIVQLFSFYEVCATINYVQVYICPYVLQETQLSVTELYKCTSDMRCPIIRPGTVTKYIYIIVTG
jgi:hypothetical protein